MDISQQVPPRMLQRWHLHEESAEQLHLHVHWAGGQDVQWMRTDAGRLDRLAALHQLVRSQPLIMSECLVPFVPFALFLLPCSFCLFCACSHHALLTYHPLTCLHFQLTNCVRFSWQVKGSFTDIYGNDHKATTTATLSCDAQLHLVWQGAVGCQQIMGKVQRCNTQGRALCERTADGNLVAR